MVKENDDTPQDAVPLLLTRVSNLLALLLVKGEEQTEKVLTLTAAGYQPAEIAPLLGISPNLVSVLIYQSKKKKRGKLAKSKADGAS